MFLKPTQKTETKDETTPGTKATFPNNCEVVFQFKLRGIWE